MASPDTPLRRRLPAVALVLLVAGMIALDLSQTRPERSWTLVIENPEHSSPSSLLGVRMACGWDGVVFAVRTGHFLGIDSCHRATFVSGTHTLSMISISTDDGRFGASGVVWQRSRFLPRTVRLVTDGTSRPPATHWMATLPLAEELGYTDWNQAQQNVQFFEVPPGAEEPSDVPCLGQRRYLGLKSSGTSLYWTVDPPHEDYLCQTVSRSEDETHEVLPLFRLSGSTKVHILKSDIAQDVVAGFRGERDFSELLIERVE